jgi:hypothetical protein
MDARHSLGTGQDARTIVTTRVFDAPRELVFEAWTNPKHLVQWWGRTASPPPLARLTCGLAAFGDSSCTAPTASIIRTGSSMTRS